MINLYWEGVYYNSRPGPMIKGNYYMKRKLTKIILGVVILALWSYLTLFVSREIQIGACVDAGGYWDQAQKDCIYIDKSTALFLIKLYENKTIIETEDILIRHFRDDLLRQFNVELSDASVLLHAYSVLSSADSLSQDVLDDVKAILAEKEE